jgi:hypothetical protein
MHDHNAPHITKTLAMFNAGYLLREILSSQAQTLLDLSACAFSL